MSDVMREAYLNDRCPVWRTSGHHQHTVIVEWIEDDVPQEYQTRQRRATKLRCACGDEVQR